MKKSKLMTTTTPNDPQAAAAAIKKPTTSVVPNGSTTVPGSCGPAKELFSGKPDEDLLLINSCASNSMSWYFI
jgi:hypothetical protein